MRTRSALAPLLATCLWSLLAGASLSAQEWLRFRGPNGSGVGRLEALPESIEPSTALWSTPVIFGRSSPIVVDGLVVVTGASNDALLTSAYDSMSGELRWSRSLPRLRRDVTSRQTGPAVSTPVSDGSAIYAFFPEFGVVAYGTDLGEERWRHELPPFASYYGMAASPVVEAGVLVLLCDQQRAPFIVGIDTANGELLWRRDRQVSSESFTTPLVRHSASDSAEVITFGTGFIDAYAPGTGEHLWRLAGTGYHPVASPILDGDRLFLMVPNQIVDFPMDSTEAVFERDSNNDGRLSFPEFEDHAWAGSFAWLDTDGDSYVSRTEWGEIYSGMSSEDFGLLAVDLAAPNGPRIEWRAKKVIPYVASPLLHRGVLFVLKDGGILTSIDPESGEVLKRGRIEGAVEPFFPSPVASEGRLYLVSNEGTVAVVTAEAEWRTLSVSELDDGVFASPAIADGRLFIRTRERLYAFGPAGH